VHWCRTRRAVPASHGGPRRRAAQAVQAECRQSADARAVLPTRPRPYQGGAPPSFTLRLRHAPCYSPPRFPAFPGPSDRRTYVAKMASHARCSALRPAQRASGVFSDAARALPGCCAESPAIMPSLCSVLARAQAPRSLTHLADAVRPLYWQWRPRPRPRPQWRTCPRRQQLSAPAPFPRSTTSTPSSTTRFWRSTRSALSCWTSTPTGVGRARCAVLATSAEALAPRCQLRTRHSVLDEAPGPIPTLHTSHPAAAPTLSRRAHGVHGDEAQPPWLPTPGDGAAPGAPGCREQPGRHRVRQAGLQ
jgi:hypothetical protein